MKRTVLSILALLLMAATGAWADDTYTIKCEANGNSKTVENVTLPHTFSCDYSGENGELDQIIKQLYGLSGGCCSQLSPGASGNSNVTAGVNGGNQFITISAPFEGNATVTGSYFDAAGGYSDFDYSLTISCPGYTPPTVDVTGVTLSQTSASMTVGGETLTLTATVAPDDATDKTVTWASSDAAVATVADGVVTAVGAGTATITATATNGTAATSDDKTATCTVTVSTTLTANEGASGEYWATYYNGTTSFTADENTTVFQTALSGSSLTLTEVPNREIPATKAVILKSSAATITLTPAETTETLTGNELKGTTEAINGNGKIYVLNYTQENGVGFYQLSANGTLGANKAYLEYNGSNARAFFSFGFDDETSGIENTNCTDDTNRGEVYDLQGRQVKQPARGLYIKSGKKVVIK